MRSGLSICEGCERVGTVTADLNTYRMEYGGTEQLCPDCVRDSRELIVEEVDT